MMTIAENDFYEDLSLKEKIYFTKRLDNQIEWYDEKSQSHQKKFKRSKMVVIISSAAIPFLVSLKTENNYLKFLIAILSISITISESYVNLNKHNENWIEYRSICETLKHEKYMYLYKTGVYRDQEERFEYFVERVETIVSQENINWASLNKEKGDSNNGK